MLKNDVAMNTEQVEDVLDEIRRSFGFPRDCLERALAQVAIGLKNVPLSERDEVLTFQLMQTVWWLEAVASEVDDPYIEEGYAQSPLTLAGQWAGFFCYQSGFGFGKSPMTPKYQAAYYGNVSVPVADGVVMMARLDNNDEPVEFIGPVFENIEQHLEADPKRYMRLSSVKLAVHDGDQGSAEYQRELSTFCRDFPYLISTLGPLIHEDFATVLVEMPALSVQAERAIHGLRDAEFIVQNLANGTHSIAVSEAPKTIVELARGDREGDHIPDLILRPLAQIVLGDVVGAKATARALLKSGAGVSLTQRWARRIVEREPSALLER